MFFFDCYFENLKNDPANQYFFKPPKESAGNKSQQEMLSRIRERNKKVWKRINWEQFIIRLLNTGYFNHPQKTSLEAVYAANFEIAIRVLNIENAM